VVEIQKIIRSFMGQYHYCIMPPGIFFLIITGNYKYLSSGKRKKAKYSR
jgi:hypothetical protein